MGNQALSLSMFILPWFTLFFLKKNERKYYMPVAIFTALTSAIIADIGSKFGLWDIREAYPFYRIASFNYGLNPVLALWVIKYTFNRFGLYMLVNTILDIGFNFFFFSHFLPNRGMFFLGSSPYYILLLTLAHAVLIYSYQMWQESALLLHEKNRSSITSLQPAVTKPLPKDEQIGSDNE